MNLKFVKIPPSKKIPSLVSTTTAMLARRVKIRLQHHRKALFIHRIRDGVLVSTINPLPGHVSSRQFSLSTITEPINRAMETLPLPLQYNIPESILSLSETWVPAGLPTYTTGIVVFAILTRLCVFTPWSYWVCFASFSVHERKTVNISLNLSRPGNGNGECKNLCDLKRSQKWSLAGVLIYEKD